MTLPKAIIDLVEEYENPEYETSRAVAVEDLERVWPTLDNGRAELIALARYVERHYTFSNDPILKRARAALKACGEVTP